MDDNFDDYFMDDNRKAEPKPERRETPQEREDREIAEATIGELNATAITAISAKIQELAAKNITTDELYAALATIAVAQITAANIEKANINWADIGELATPFGRNALCHFASASAYTETCAQIDEVQSSSFSSSLIFIARRSRSPS